MISGIWLKCKECGYEFKVGFAYKRLQSTWCRRCGQNVDITKEKEEISALSWVIFILVAIVGGCLLSMLMGR